MSIEEEMKKGLDMALSWGIEAYSLDKETGKVKLLSLDEALELKDNPNYEIVSTEDCSPEELMQRFTSYLTPEELEALSKPILEIKTPSDVNWDVEKWLEYGKANKVMIVDGDEKI